MGIRDSEIMSLVIGDVIYECEQGLNLEARVTSTPNETITEDGKRQWSWTAENTQNGKAISYLLTEGLSHYGPRLYREPQYGLFRAGQFHYPLLGAGA